MKLSTISAAALCIALVSACDKKEEVTVETETMADKVISTKDAAIEKSKDAMDAVVDKSKEIKDSATEKMDQVGEKVSEATDATKAQASEMKDAVADKYDSAKTTAEQTISKDKYGAARKEAAEVKDKAEELMNK